jgi:hypothetical protein
MFPQTAFEAEGRVRVLAVHAVEDMRLSQVTTCAKGLSPFARIHGHVEVAVHRIFEACARGIGTTQDSLSRLFPVAPKQRDKS